MKYLVLSVLVAGAAACGSEPPVDVAADAPRMLEGIQVAAAGGVGAYRAVGSVRASRRAELATRQMARIETVRARPGDRVRAGQLLVTLERGAIAAQGASATASVELAAANLRRMERLHADSAIPLAQLEVARANYLQAKGQADQASNEFGYASLTAPFSGIVTARHADPGDLASPGQPVLTVEADGPSEIVIGAPEQVAARVKVGQVVIVAIGDDERQVEARVAAIVPAADPLTRTVEIRLVAGVSVPTGLAAVAELPLGSTTGSAGLAIPSDAIVRRGELIGVFLFVPDSTVRLRWIRLGRSHGDRVDVVSGLGPGDVIVRRPAGVIDGTRALPTMAGGPTQ
jgi:RND family efflux transporter MFP subunit